MTGTAKAMAHDERTIAVEILEELEAEDLRELCLKLSVLAAGSLSVLGRRHALSLSDVLQRVGPALAQREEQTS